MNLILVRSQTLLDRRYVFALVTWIPDPKMFGLEVDHLTTGVYNDPHSPPLGGGGYQIHWGRISSCEEGKVIQGLLGRISREKR